jgi:putative Holliday junction resolvase
MRYLAIDYGARRTGLAICDCSETIASPLRVLQDRKQLAARIAEIVRDEGVDAVVLGLPLNMDGSEGPQAKSVLAFAEQLRRQIGVPIHFQDERLSTFGADDKLRSDAFTPRQRRDRRDAVAAAEILTAFLEAKGG